MAESKEPEQIFTSTDRIRQLNDVDRVGYQHHPAMPSQLANYYSTGCRQTNPLSGPRDPSPDEREIRRHRRTCAFIIIIINNNKPARRAQEALPRSHLAVLRAPLLDRRTTTPTSLRARRSGRSSPGLGVPDERCPRGGWGSCRGACELVGYQLVE